MTLVENVRSESFEVMKTLRFAVAWVMLMLNGVSNPAGIVDNRLFKMSPFLDLNSTHGLFESSIIPT